MIKISHYASLKQILSAEGIHIYQPLFHATSFANASHILQEGIKAKAGTTYDDAYHDNAVCFTRNLGYVLEGIFGPVVFILDERELSTRFKTYAYDYNQVQYGHMPHNKRKHPEEYEYETRVSVTPGKYKHTPNSADFCLTNSETKIPPRYIKAVLIKRLEQKKALLEKLEGTGLPVILYYRNKYHTLAEMKAARLALTPNKLKETSFQEKSQIAIDTLTPPDILVQLANGKSGTFQEKEKLRYLVAKNESAPPELLDDLARFNTHPDLVDRVLNNKSTAVPTLEYILLNHRIESASALATLAKREDITRDMFKKLMTEDSISVRIALTMNPSFPKRFLLFLAKKDTDPTVARLAALELEERGGIQPGDR